MAFWRKNKPEFNKTDTIIEQNPGISKAELARQLGVQRSTIHRRLPSMEDAGYLYAEDDHGRLWPFKRRK